MAQHNVSLSSWTRTASGEGRVIAIIKLLMTSILSSHGGKYSHDAQCQPASTAALVKQRPLARFVSEGARRRNLAHAQPITAM